MSASSTDTDPHTLTADTYTIGELSRLTDTKAVTIRYYESEDLVHPASRTAAGYRLFDTASRDRLHFIRRCRRLGLGLADIRQLLQLSEQGQGDQGRSSCEGIDAIIHRQLEQVRERLRDLRALEDELDRLEHCCDADSIDECKIIESLSAQR